MSGPLITQLTLELLQEGCHARAAPTRARHIKAETSELKYSPLNSFFLKKIATTLVCFLLHYPLEIQLNDTLSRKGDRERERERGGGEAGSDRDISQVAHGGWLVFADKYVPLC